MADASDWGLTERGQDRVNASLNSTRKYTKRNKRVHVVSFNSAILTLSINRSSWTVVQKDIPVGLFNFSALLFDF